MLFKEYQNNVFIVVIFQGIIIVFFYVFNTFYVFLIKLGFCDFFGYFFVMFLVRLSSSSFMKIISGNFFVYFDNFEQIIIVGLEVVFCFELMFF